MPFGIKKPSVAAVPYKGTQKVYFEESPETGVIKNNVYPNLTYLNLELSMRETPVGGINLKSRLIKMSQTESEKRFFNSYANLYDMWSEEIPVLIPQAWIQWHSSTKKELRHVNSSYNDDLYRVDFVVFWENKRFAILLDDIKHYATKYYQYWNASQENYAKRLKEDRKLRKEDWEVFRISNWEMREERFISELLVDLRDCIGF